jgi:hypothetical protein
VIISKAGIEDSKHASANYIKCRDIAVAEINKMSGKTRAKDIGECGME